jgi:spermidine synthase
MLSHPPLFTHPFPAKVLIIGGGDCGTLTRVLQHDSVRKVVQVEIDEMVTRVARKFFPQLAVAANDPRAELVFDDGISYITACRNEFDVILVDSTDPVGPAEGLFRREFYQACHRALKPEGILCIQSESPWIPSLQEVIRSSYHDLGAIFREVHPYLASIQTYQAGLWMFQLASKAHSPFAPEVRDRIAGAGLAASYYNANLHQACFVLPEFVRNLLLREQK